MKRESILFFKRFLSTSDAFKNMQDQSSVLASVESFSWGGDATFSLSDGGENFQLNGDPTQADSREFLLERIVAIKTALTQFEAAVLSVPVRVEEPEYNGN